MSTDRLGNVLVSGHTSGDLDGANNGLNDSWVALVRDSATLGDTNGDNLIDLADLNNVRNNFGAWDANPVPEPSAAVRLVIGGGLLGVAPSIRRALKMRPNTGS